MKFLLFVLAVLAIAALVLGVTWGIWLLWCAVLPQLWASGPANVIHPSFWLFVGMWFLLGFLGNALFGGKS